MGNEPGTSTRDSTGLPSRVLVGATLLAAGVALGLILSSLPATTPGAARALLWATLGLLGGLLLAGLAAVIDRRRLTAALTTSAREREDLQTLIRTAYESGPVGVAILDLRAPDLGRFLMVNPTLADFLGRDREGLLGLSVHDVLDPADRDLADALLLDMARGDVREEAVERQFTRPDGSPVWGLCSPKVLPGHDGRPDTLIVHVQNVDAAHRLRTEIDAQHRFVQTVVSNIDVGIIACDPAGTINYFNATVLEQFSGTAWAEDALPEEWPSDFIPRGPDGEPMDRTTLPHVIAGREGRPVRAESTFLRADGEIRTHLVSAKPILNERGETTGVVSAIHDITSQKDNEAALTHLAMSDILTGLPNRLRLGNRLREALARPSLNGGLAVLFLDLDRFKVINDSRGHEVGDRLLRLVADRIKGELRPGDIAARMGGDEFVVLCDGIVGEIEALGVADRIRAAVQRPLRIDGDEVVVTCSVGVVMAEPHEDADEVIRRADLAMYRAKDDGRGAVRVYQPEFGVSMARRFRLEGQLREAIREGDIEVVYQPIIGASGGATTGVEALARWRRGDRLIGPAHFIDVAVDSGLIIDIDRQVLQVACGAARLSEGGLGVSVNMSSRMLANEGLVDLVTEALERTDLEADRLCLELTERALINAAPSIDRALLDLRDMGVLLALDDFGTGYASLNYLRRFPVDIVKIDHSFVRDILDSDTDLSIVSAIVDMAGQMGLRTVAEGIETAEQANRLTELGCDALQGFWFARPGLAHQVPGFRPSVFTPDQHHAG